MLTWHFSYTPEGIIETETGRLVVPEDAEPSIVTLDSLMQPTQYGRTDGPVTAQQLQQLIPEPDLAPSLIERTDAHYERLLAEERITNEALWQQCLALQRRIAELEHES